MTQVPLKRIVRNITERRNFRKGEERYVGLEHVTSWSGSIRKDNEADPEALVGVFSQGDVLFGKLRPYLAKVVAPDFDGVCSTELLVLRANNERISPRFVRYSMVSRDFIDRVNGATFGVKMPRASWANIGKEKIWIPDVRTQNKISDFLDRKTATIDALIEKNERLISLCEEKTRAVIDNVFSKAKSLIAIKHVADINYDTLSSNSPDDMEIRYADLSRVCPRGGIDPEVMAFKDAPSRARRIVHENDVLFASVGPFSKKVLSAKKEDEGTVVSTGFFVMKAKRGHHSRFLEKILQSTHVLSEVEKGAVGAIYAAINDTTFRNIRIPALSYEEQVKFSEDMEAQISNLSALSEKSGRMNALLKEKRSALITAAVTGQIDIPE